MADVDDDPPAPDQIDDDDDDDDVAAPAGDDDDDDDDDAIAPPEDAPPDLPPDPYAASKSFFGAKAGAGGVPTRRRRNRSASMWAAGIHQPSGGGGGADGVDIPRITTSRPAHTLENALRYRTMMRPQPAPLLYGEEKALADGVEAYLVAAGLGKTLGAFRAAQQRRHADLRQREQQTPQQQRQQMLFGSNSNKSNGAGNAGGRPASETTIPPSMPLYKHVMAAARRTAHLFDDDVPWNAESFFASELPFLTLEDHGRSQQFATIDRLIERLVLAEAGGPLIPRQVEINFTTVFFLTAPLVVCADVLLSKMFKLFKTVSLHKGLLGDAKAARWHVRILDVLSEYLSLNRVDVTRVVAERALSFAVSTAHSGGQATEVLRAANRLIEKVQAIGFEDGPDARRWVRQPHFDPELMVNAERPALAMGGAFETDDPTGPGSPLRVRADAAISDITDVSERELAEQLTLLHFELYSRVSCRELCNGAWCDPLLRHAGAAPNLIALLTHREHLVLWVASLIITPTDVAQRQSIYARMIRVARMLFDAQNFFGAEALLAGLDHSSLNNLKTTTAASALESAEVESLAALQAAFDTFNGTAKSVPFNLTTPAVPVLTPHLAELARLHESTRNAVEKVLNTADLQRAGAAPADPNAAVHDDPEDQRAGAARSAALAIGTGGKVGTHHQAIASEPGLPTQLINWSKLTAVGRVLLRVVSYQSLAFDYVPNPAVQRFIRQMPLRRGLDALYDLANDRSRAGGG